VQLGSQVFLSLMGAVAWGLTLAAVFGASSPQRAKAGLRKRVTGAGCC